MKKRITSLILVVAMLAMTLVGCGSDTTDTTNTTNEPNIETNTEVDEPVEDVVTGVPTDVPTEEPIETPSVDEPTEDIEVEEPIENSEVDAATDDEVVDDAKDDVVVEDSNEDEKYSDSYSWTFPEGMDGFTDKYVFNGNESWSLNFTHYVNNDGKEMNFLWEGPTALGERATSNGKALFLFGENNNYHLCVWNGNYGEGDYENCINLSKETWTSFAPVDIPYVENGYYDVEVTDTTIEVTFKVLGIGYEGYNYYVLDTINEIGYQFAYLENIEIYDDTRAMNVINSISYWDYIPE